MNNIYVLWWQGIENAPDIIKICYNSLKNNINPNKQRIILIDSNNYHKYVEIPDFVIEKFENKKISMTHLSDLIRFKLLYENGGLWVDASIFFTNKLDNSIFKKDLFVLNNPTAIEGDITSKWECFLIGGKKSNPLFKFVYEFWIEYWKKEDELIAYLLTEHFFYIAYHNDLNIKKMFDSADNFTYPLDYVQNLLNKPYDDKIFNEIISKEKFIKMSYKKPLSITNNNELTYFGKLMELYNEKN